VNNRFTRTLAFAVLTYLIVGLGNEMRQKHVAARVIPLTMEWNNVTHVGNLTVSQASHPWDPEDDVLQSVSGGFAH